MSPSASCEECVSVCVCVMIETHSIIASVCLGSRETRYSTHNTITLNRATQAPGQPHHEEMTST